MNLIKHYLANNDCYKLNQKLNLKGLMLHSTGANNPYVKRYVGTHEMFGKNTYNNDWNRKGVSACVHGFIGYDKDKNIVTVQTLPWNMRSWHCGRSANDTHISIEICESTLTDKVYFDKVYKEAVELFAYLCKEFKLDPIKNIICHSEGHKLGIASNHADVMHWFPKHGKNMDTFRNDVRALLIKEIKTYELIIDVPAYTNSANALNGINSTTTYKNGSYFIYNEANGMINITKTQGKAGGWINPKDNVIKETPIEEPIIEEDKPIEIVEPIIEVKQSVINIIMNTIIKIIKIIFKGGK